jgi:ribosomal protein L17
MEPGMTDQRGTHLQRSAEKLIANGTEDRVFESRQGIKFLGL